MANKSLAELRREIDALEARVEGEKRRLKDALHATGKSLRPRFSSRTGMAGAFLTAVIVGVVGGRRLMASRRAARAR
jgi:uncharacterized protein YktB (UPF0637 family)